jgi:threonine dehydratase/serine racemase
VSTSLPDRGDVLAAAERIGGRILATPVVHRDSFSRSLGCDVYFKCESFQRTGSFKFRGASNAVAQLPDGAKGPGVATHSSGNHGAALALAARQAGMPAHIVVPRGASPVKREAIVTYGGIVVDCGETLEAREAALEQVRAETGAAYVPPYDHPHVIAGQGTAALELARDVSGLDEVWVPVGGGGLASGTLLALADTGIRVVGVEPELADDAYWSLERGRIQPQRPPKTIADGLRTALGDLPFAIFGRYGMTIRTVSEAAILSAQRLVWQRLKIVIETSSAVPLAGLLEALETDRSAYATRRVGVIVSGGNVSFPGS